MRSLKLLPLALLLLAAAAQSTAQAAPQVTTVVRGLDAPRHLAFSRGQLFVAEAGRGGSGPCFMGPEGPACMGATGAVTRIDRNGHRSRVAKGLPSFANTPGGTHAIGPHGIAVRGSRVYITNGGPGDPADNSGATLTRDALARNNGAAALFGRVLRIKRGGPGRIADIYAFERANNPDAQVGNPGVDSNPVGLLLDGSRFVVADAGGNALDIARPGGRVSALAIFPNRDVPGPSGAQVAMQAVPTGVALGPGGSYYVSELTGFPFPAAAANVYRVNRRTGAISVAASGFTNIMDLAFGRDGTLYVLEFDHDGLLTGTTDGAVIAVSPNGARRQLQLPAGTLTEPGGIAIGPRGTLFVTNQSGTPGAGQVLRIVP